MKIEGRISGVSRKEHAVHDEKHEPALYKRVCVVADVEWKREGALKPSELTLTGYEPGVEFRIGDRVTLIVEDGAS